MAIPTTYAELKTEIANQAHRGDLTDDIPAFIRYCETDLEAKLRVKSMIAEATVTPSQVNKYVDLPTGYLEPIAFTDDLGDDLIQVHFDELQDYRYGNSTSRPRYWAETSRLEFDRVADSAYTFTMLYYKGLDLATDDTNNVLTKYPNLYVFGSLIHLANFIRDRDMLDWASSVFSEELKMINTRAQQSLKSLRTDHPSVPPSFNIIRGY